MKSLQEHLMESLSVNEALNLRNFKPQYTVDEWQKWLNAHKPDSANYSQLFGIEAAVSDLQDGSVKPDDLDNELGNNASTPEDISMLKDMALFIAKYYRIEMGEINDYTYRWWKKLRNDRNALEWATDEEGYTTKVKLKRNKPTGDDLKYAQVLAKRGIEGLPSIEEMEEYLRGRW